MNRQLTLAPFFQIANEIERQSKIGRVMKTDIVENDNNYVLTSEIPGVNKEDVKVKYEDNTLFISVESKQENFEEKEGKIVHQERYVSKQQRQFTFNDNIDLEGISAKLENGLLVLTLNKKAKDNVKEISIL